MATRSPRTSARGVRDPERVRSLALEASVKLFAERGFAGTSFQNISDACGVSVGLIQYHFGSKEQLYEAVKEHAMQAYAESQAPQFALPLEQFYAFVDRGLRQYFRFFEQHSDWPRLSAWAELEGDQRAWPSEHVLMDRLVERVRAAQRAGELDTDVDPEVFLIALAGMMQGWLRYRVRYASRLEHLGNARYKEDAYMALVLRLLQDGLRRNGSSVDGPARTVAKRKSKVASRKAGRRGK